MDGWAPWSGSGSCSVGLECSRIPEGPVKTRHDVGEVQKKPVTILGRFPKNPSRFRGGRKKPVTILGKSKKKPVAILGKSKKKPS